MNTEETQGISKEGVPPVDVDIDVNVDDVKQDESSETEANKPAEDINLLGGDSESESTEAEGYVHENAPDEYTLDEGVELADSAMFDALSPAFKEANVSNKQLNSIVKAHTEQSALVFNERKNQMGAETLKDPLFSGDAGKTNLSIANNAVNEYGGKEFAKLLHDTGLGNNINVVKTFYEIGRAMEEDSPVGDKAMDNGKPMSDVDKFYERTSY